MGGCPRKRRTPAGRLDNSIQVVSIDELGNVYLVVLRAVTKQQNGTVFGGSTDCNLNPVGAFASEAQVWFSPPPTSSNSNPSLQPALPLGRGAVGDSMPAVAPLPIEHASRRADAAVRRMRSPQDHRKHRRRRPRRLLHSRQRRFLVTYQRDATGLLAEIGNRVMGARTKCPGATPDRYHWRSIHSDGERPSDRAAIALGRDDVGFSRRPVGRSTTPGPECMPFSGRSIPIGTTRQTERTRCTFGEATPGLAVLSSTRPAIPSSTSPSRSATIPAARIAVADREQHRPAHGEWKGAVTIGSSSSGVASTRT